MRYYSYNGTILPKLPEATKNLYPHAFIYFRWNTVYERYNTTLFYSNMPYMYVEGTDGTVGYRLYSSPGAVCWFQDLTTENGEPAWGDATNQPYGVDSNIIVDHPDHPVFLWTTGFYNESGELTMDPSPAPVLVSSPSLQSLMTFFALGIAAQPMLTSEKQEPVAYLYNGVKLPALPEWDRERYPYAHIGVMDSYGRYAFAAESKALTVLGNIYVTKPEVNYSCESSVDTWVAGGLVSFTAYKVLWANHDVIDANGNLLLDASDPVPIYE